MLCNIMWFTCVHTSAALFNLWNEEDIHNISLCKLWSNAVYFLLTTPFQQITYDLHVMYHYWQCQVKDIEASSGCASNSQLLSPTLLFWMKFSVQIWTPFPSTPFLFRIGTECKMCDNFNNNNISIADSIQIMRPSQLELSHRLFNSLKSTYLWAFIFDPNWMIFLKLVTEWK